MNNAETNLKKADFMDYELIPTTVFSKVEYSFVGDSEQDAIKKYGEDKIEVYHKELTPLERSIYENNKEISYLKIICLKDSQETVIGIHYLGPAAGEVIGGFALAMKLGLTRQHLKDSLGIHPTVSEEFFNLDITKRSGLESIVTGKQIGRAHV